MDALLGAAALGDIGKHFPDNDDRYKGISSLELLRQVGKLLDEKNYVIENIDATIIAQKPKMRPYIDEMRKNIADTLKLGHRPCQCKGNDRGRTWLYPVRERAFLPRRFAA